MLSPFTITKTMNFFGASRYLVDKSRKSKELFGILPVIPTYHKGKMLTNVVKNKVISFYEDDDISRLCPGKNDFLSIKNENGVREHKQKRLLLGNLKELYTKYKETHKDAIGFSTFAKLRPRWCVMAGGKGTHNVCVCVQHQNTKLMVSAIGVTNLNYKDLLNKTVCNLEEPKCMLRQCRNCPRKEILTNYLKTFEILEERDSINYSQWVSTDRSNLIITETNTDDFIDLLGEKIYDLSRHHFIAKAQSKYLKDLKNKLPHNEIIALVDFSENYSFVVQDASQGFHWTNDQVTLHPVVVYYNQPGKDTLQHHSYCFISDCLNHSTSMVYAFQEKLIEDLKKKFTNIQKIHYFSDGCVAQYKNKFNFINICHHEEDFKISCEWHFYATSHGKNACDGIGGSVKRYVAKASLQRVTTNHILSPEKFFSYCEENIKGITFIYTSKLEINIVNNKLQERYLKCVTLKGTRGYHKIIPVSKGTVKAFQISQSESFITSNISEILEDTEDVHKFSLDETIYVIGQYVACNYDGKMWIGLLENISEEFEEFSVNFLQLYKEDQYIFPLIEDKLWVERKNILAKLSIPTIIPATKIIYRFNKHELNKAKTLLK